MNQKKHFMNPLQDEVNKTPEQKEILVLGDLNAGITNISIPSIMNRSIGDHINSKEETLIDFINYIKKHSGHI